MKRHDIIKQLLAIVACCFMFAGCDSDQDGVPQKASKDAGENSAVPQDPQATSDKPSNTKTFTVSEKDRNIFGADDRQPITTDRYPWCTIGKVSDCGCTGTLIGPDLVLTAAHCMIDPSTRKLRRDITYFRPNYRYHKSKDKAWIDQVWWGTDNPDKNRGEDWAILKLRKPLGKLYGWLGIHHTDVRTFPVRLTVAGYSADFWGGGTAGVHHNGYTRNRYADHGFILHDCDNTRGCSGGPALQMYKDALTIYGVNVAEYRQGGEKSLRLPGYSDKYANVAIPSHQFLKLAGRLLGLSRSLDENRGTRGYNPDADDPEVLAAAELRGEKARTIGSSTDSSEPPVAPDPLGAGSAFNPEQP